MDRLNCKKLKNTYSDINSVNMKGEDFLKEFKGNIDFLYLDAFDYDHGQHSSIRKSRYKEEMNCEITNPLCHKMHLDCVVNSYKKISKDGVIVFDDVLGDFSKGKGVTAIPFLLNNGFKLLKKTAQCAAFVRK